MDEPSWQSSEDPQAMLAFLRAGGRLSGRKAQLFAAAVCRRVWHRMRDRRSRHAVEVVELLADGLAGPPQVEAAWEAAREAHEAAMHEEMEEQAASWAAEGAASSAGHALAGETVAAADAAVGAVLNAGPTAEEAVEQERRFQADLLRCVSGPLPFRSPHLGPGWRTPLVLSLAQAAYDERVAPDPSRPGWLVLDPARLLVLADAVEEAGCDDADILAHCRRPGEHVRGCWVADLVLAKQ